MGHGWYSLVPIKGAIMGKLGTPVVATQQAPALPQVPAWPVNTKPATPRIRDAECTPMTAAYRSVKRVEDSKLVYARGCARTLAQGLITHGKKDRADETKWLEGMFEKYGVAKNHIAHAVRIVRQMVHASNIKIHTGV
jgi:hypothetical protein